MKLPNKSAISIRLQSGTLMTDALRYRADERFDEHEVSYKKAVARKLRESFDACRRNEKHWTKLLNGAFQAKDNNLTAWQTHRPFCEWALSNPAAARKAVFQLLDPERDLQQRMTNFCGRLEHAGIPKLRQAGAQLILGSVLLMGTDFENCPPVRTDVVGSVIRALDLTHSVRQLTAPERYALFLRILDQMVTLSRTEHVRFGNRIEAQGALWCCHSRWMDRFPPPAPSYPNRDAYEDIEAATQELSDLPATEKAAVVDARRGQGRFRNALLKRWRSCAVTGCDCPEILRASHVKPWRDCNNEDRLNPDNGLLLSPTLDALFDLHLISFSKDGGILISDRLLPDEQLILGISADLALRKTFPRMERFLDHHQRTFKKREKERSR